MNINTTSNVQNGEVLDKKVLRQIIGLGIVAGMRTTFAPAVLSNYIIKSPGLLADSNWRFIASRTSALLTKIFAAGEIVGDKLPNTADRICFPQIIGRIASGTFVGMVMSKSSGYSIIKGGLIGGLSAIAGSYSAFYLRKYIDTVPGVHDAYVGAGEDVLALTTGILMLN